MFETSPVDEATGATTEGTGVIRLADLRLELEDLLLRYSESHPNVVAKKRQIEEFLARQGDRGPVGDPEAPTPEAPAGDVLDMQWSLQLRAAQRELDELRSQEQTLRGQIATYQRRIASTPVVEAEIQDRSRGVEALRQRYEKLQRDILQAKGAQEVEERQKGHSFKVVDAAGAPAMQIFPNPPLVLVVALVAGLALFVGPAIFRRLVSPLVSSEAGLRQLSQVPVLVAIPSIPSPTRHRQARRRFMKNFGLSVVSLTLLAGVVALHYFDKL